MNVTLHAIAALVLATTLPAFAQRPQGRPGGPEQNRLPEGTRIERDLVYGSAGGRELKLNLYLPPGDEPKPLIIWIHGGAWLQGSKDGPSPAQQFVGSGYAVAHVGYRLSQVAKWPAQMHDCKAAVRWLRANAAQYHLDPKRLAAWGSSAGGHLVAVLGTSGGVPELEGASNDVKASSSVQAVVDWFGPTDFLQMSKFPSNIAHDEARSPESQLIGGPIQEDKDATAKANPITYVGRGDAPPPFLMMHGTRDELVPFNQSELLRDALQAAKADVTFHPVNGAGHGFSGEQNISTVREFLTRVFAVPAEGRVGLTPALKPAQGANVQGGGKSDARPVPSPPRLPGGGPRDQAPPPSGANRPSPWGSPVRVGGSANMKAFEYKQVDPQPLHLWVFYPEGWKATDTRAGMVFFCGGAWSHADHNEFVPWASYLASRGMVAAVAEYRPRGALTCDEDATSAIRWFRAHSAELGVDPKRIGASGGSAGGQMAASVAMCEPRNSPDEDLKISAKPNVLVLFDAVLDMKTERAAQRLSAAEKLAVSPIDHMTKDTVPTLLFYGTQCPFVEQAREFLSKSKTLGYSVQLYTAPDGNHTYYIRPPWRQLTFAHMDEFLVARGFLTGAATFKVETDLKHTNENVSPARLEP